MLSLFLNKNNNLFISLKHNGLNWKIFMKDNIWIANVVVFDFKKENIKVKNNTL